MILIFFFSFTFSQNKLYIYGTENKKGLVDSEGNLKTATDFDEITDLGKDDWAKTKAFLIQKTEKFGLMNEEGKWIYPLQYDEIFCKSDTCKLQEKTKYGYGNSKGKLIIPMNYDDLGFISENKIKALKNGKWGFINLKNEWIIEPKFNANEWIVYDFSEGLAKICFIEKENSCGYIDVKGEMIIPQIYDSYSGDFHDGLAKIQLINKIAYINTSGKIAFPLDYNYSAEGDFKNGVALVSKSCKQYDDHGVCEHYLINTKGQNILPKDCIVERSFPEENYTVIRNLKTGNKGVVNNQGKIVVPVEFSDVGNYEGPFNWISVSKYNKDQYEMSGFYDKKGNKITEPIYNICGTYSDETNPKSETFICIERQNGEGRGALDKNGKAILPPDFQDVDFTDGVFKVSKLDRKAEIGGIYNPSCGYLNENGSVLIPLQYLSCSKFNNGLATVLDKNGWKIINKNNETLKKLSNEFEEVTQFSNGFSHVGKEGKNGLINTKGEITVPLIYDYIYHYNDVIQVKKGDKSGIIDATGKIIVPIIYEYVSLSTCSEKVFGKNGEKYTWYNLEGKKRSDNIPISQCYNED